MSESYEELMMPLFLRLGGGEETESAQAVTEASLPVEAANALAVSHRAAMRALEEQVLAHVYTQSPRFFENLIVDLFLEMGYANRRRDLVGKMSRSHDGGVDACLALDPLGMDIVILQAKRLKPNSCVSASQIRDFIGTLETKRASKGVFVTTGQFSGFARSAVVSVSHRVRLIDGRELGRLMVRHNIGVKATQSYVFKVLDRNYFTSGKDLNEQHTA